MKSGTSWRYIVSLALLTSTLLCATERTGQLVIDSTIKVDEFAPSIVVPVKCNPSGDISVRVSGGGRGPILKIARVGRRIVRFSIDTVPGLLEARIYDFATGVFGDIYVLARDNRKQTYIVHFADDGQYKSKHILDARLQPGQIAVFRSGQLLIAGQHEPAEGEEGINAKPFIGIFNESGKLLKELSLRKDVEPKLSKSSESQGGDADRPGPDRTYEEATVLSSAVGAEDGNIYFMRHTPNGPVFVVSPSGGVRRIDLSPPKDTQLSAIQVGNGRIAAEFLRFLPKSDQIGSVILEVIDAQTGEREAEYSHSDFNIGSGFACYAQNDFTFLGSDPSGRLTIIEAKGN